MYLQGIPQKCPGMSIDEDFTRFTPERLMVITLVLLNEFIIGISIPLSWVSLKIYKENPISGTSL